MPTPVLQGLFLFILVFGMQLGWEQCVIAVWKGPAISLEEIPCKVL